MQRLKQVYDIIPSLMKNKYVVAFVFFIIWMLFFDTNTFWSQIKMRMKLQNMEAKRTHYFQQIDKVNKELHELLTNDANLEKYARENYLMKKEGEDVFVIKKEKLEE